MAHARRTFLKYISLVGGAVSATLLGIPVIRSFVSPAFRRILTETWVEIGPIDDLEIALPVRKEFPRTVTVESSAVPSLSVIVVPSTASDVFSAISRFVIFLLFRRSFSNNCPLYSAAITPSNIASLNSGPNDISVHVEG